MAQTNKAKIPVGFVLSGKYRITREIGRGGMAAVYEAENVDIGKRVAIKVLAQELTTSVVVVERFLREARAAAAIRSPYICDVYDSGRLEDGRPFLVLELLEGESLYERMTKVRHLDVETTIQVITQTCRGLTKAHAASIVHRDLKPENIFLTRDEEGNLLSKILDFGLAKFYAPMEGSERQARLTREGAVFGTPAYMSPEQVRGQGAVDHRADLWALGCITYECLTGKTVWATEQGVAMTFAQIANAPLPRPNKLRPDLPAKFTDWFDKALNRDIEQRFQSAKEFAEELAEAFEHGLPSFSAIHNFAHLNLPDPTAEETTKRVGPSPAAGSPPEKPPAARSDRPAGDVEVVFSEPPPPAPRSSKAAFAAPTAAAAGTSTTAGTAATPKPAKSTNAGRIASIAVVAAVVLAGGYLGWQRFGPQRVVSPTPATSSGTPEASANPATSAPSARPSSAPTAGGPPWKPLVAEGQAAAAADDLKTAARLFKEAFDKGGHGVPRTMLDHVQVALTAAATKQPCRLTGIGRPRTYDLGDKVVRVVGAGRPAIRNGPRGPVITWTDSHDGSEHAYAVALDGALRSVADPVDVTPEGTAIGRPELVTADDRFVLTYWDAKGPESGVHVRWLDGDGRIAGPSVVVAPSRGGNFWPTLARTGDSFHVVWSNEEGDSEDLYLRRLTATLEPEGEVARLTDLAQTGGNKPRARVPWMAVANDALFIGYRLERDPEHLIELMRLPIAEATKGLPAAPKTGPRVDRTVGEVVLVNSDKAKADSPGVVCSGAGCFLVWHGESNGGASAAFVDASPPKPQPLWRKKFSKLGGDPSVAVAGSGEAQIVWYERGVIMTASLGRDGVGIASKVARISGDQPMPSVAPGAKAGEWLLAWLDFEAAHLEPYAARVMCK